MNCVRINLTERFEFVPWKDTCHIILCTPSARWTPTLRTFTGISCLIYTISHLRKRQIFLFYFCPVFNLAFETYLLFSLIVLRGTSDTGYFYETCGDLFCHIMQVTSTEHSLFNWIFSSYWLTTLWHLACGLIPITKLASYFASHGGMIKRPLSTMFWGWLSFVFRCTLLQELWHILGKICMLGERGEGEGGQNRVWTWHSSEWGQIVHGLCKANYLVTVVLCGRFHTADLHSVLKQTAK